MDVTAESEVADDNSESEDNDYYCHLPRETLNTDFIETQILTRDSTCKGKTCRRDKTTNPVSNCLASCSCRPGKKDIDINH